MCGYQNIKLYSKRRNIHQFYFLKSFMFGGGNFRNTNYLATSTHQSDSPSDRMRPGELSPGFPMADKLQIASGRHPNPQVTSAWVEEVGWSSTVHAQSCTSC